MPVPLDVNSLGDLVAPDAGEGEDRKAEETEPRMDEGIQVLARMFNSNLQCALCV